MGRVKNDMVSKGQELGMDALIEESRNFLCPVREKIGTPDVPYEKRIPREYSYGLPTEIFVGQGDRDAVKCVAWSLEHGQQHIPQLELVSIRDSMPVVEWGCLAMINLRSGEVSQFHGPDQ
jgi:hypothetical protein